MQNDYQPGEDLPITIAHIEHNIKVLTVIHKKAQALLDKPIEALYAMTDAFEEGEPANMPMNLKAVTRIQKVDAILRDARAVIEDARLSLAIMACGGINLESFNSDSMVMRDAVALEVTTGKAVEELSVRWLEHSTHLDTVGEEF